jgi:transposase-like protein
MSSKRKRVSYTAEFKLNVIEKAEEVGNREAGRVFNVDESNIRLWRKSKENFSETGRYRRSFRRGVTAWPDLEDALHHWILEQRENGAPISTINIRKKAKLLAVESGIENFIAGPTWCHRFMRRKNLSIRNRTTVGQKLPEDWELKKNSFLEFTRNLISTYKFSESEIYNMDEVPVSFDIPPSRTVDQIGKKSIKINTTGHERNCFTVVLACAADGSKLPAMIIYKRRTVPKENLPSGVQIEVNPKGWMNEEIMTSWLNTVWRKRKNSLFKPRALLIMDSMAAHIKESVKKEVKSTGAKLSIIPGGLTKLLQPLDVGVNRSFKSKLRSEWEKWMTQGIHSFTDGGRMRRASYAEVAQWVKTAWEAVEESTIKNAFKKCEIVQNCNIDEEENYDDDDDDFLLNDNVLDLFLSDTDDSEFEGFE